MVLVVCIPGLALVIVAFPLSQDQTRDAVTHVKAGATVTASGYTWTLTDAREFVGTGTGDGGNHIPIGSSLVAALIEVKPTKAATTDNSCDAALALTSKGQSWQPLDDVSTFNYAIGDGDTQYCVLEGDPFELETVFIAPTGVYDERPTVELTIGGAKTVVLGFGLPD